MNYLPKVAFYTLGCKLNFSETSTIARLFEGAGFAKVDFEETPDVFVINTCSVTDHADKKCRNIVNRALRINPHAFVAVVGCYAQLKPGEIADIPGVDVVLGANEKFDILSHLNDLNKHEDAVVLNSAIKHVKNFIPGFSSNDRTRTFLKVQDGCNYFCAFCTIPLARGRSRSATVAETVEKAVEVAETGAKEVVLTGVNIGDFGHGTSETLLDLLVALDKVKGIERYRISSIEPNLLTDEIIEFVSNSRHFLPHFHIPLQSGSDTILKLMRRRYLTAVYDSRVSKIRQLMPDACIGVDVIVGFPGESEEEFLNTYRFLQELDVNYFHVFTYSERDNTTAIRLSDVVPIEVRQQRNKMLRILSEKKKRAFYQAQVGKVFRVLFEADEEAGMMFGFTENYLKIKVPHHPNLVNTIQRVFLEEIDRDGIGKGKVLQPEIVVS